MRLRLRPSVRLAAESALLGLVVGLLVVAPWTRGGYLLLLDWVSGPSQTLNPGVYGLEGGALDVLPWRIGVQVLRAVVGTAATAWLVVLAFFPLAAAGASQLAGGGRWRRHSAALLMVCNPFVVDRVHAGHVAFLLGVALLPWLMRSAVHARQQERWVAVRPAGWYALGMALDAHVFWLGGAVLLAVALLPRPTWRDLVRTMQVGLAAGLVYAYGAAVWLAGIRTIRVTQADLDAYATVSGPGGLLTTLLSLHGFWRDFDDQARTALPGLVLLVALVALLVLVAVGLARLVAVQSVVGLPLVALALLGIVLASGVAGPLAPAYRWAFEHVPLFEAMREQQKWLSLTVIAFAVGFGVAVEWLAALTPTLVTRLRKQRRRVARDPAPTGAERALAALLAGVALLVPAASAPALLWGLGGTIAVSTYPFGWYESDARMGNGDELVIFLPWHGYQPFDFTDGRSVATPAEAFFRRPVITSDSVELKGLRTDSVSLRMAYLDRLVAEGGGGTSFGRMVAPLGVRYVALSTQREADRYTWLDDQSDLELVFESDSMRLYEVLPSGTGRVVSSRTVPGVDRALVLAAEDELGTEAVVTEGTDDGTLPSSASGELVRDAATRWIVRPGTAGWVVVPEEWSPGWQVDGSSGVPTVAGTVAVRAGGDETVVEYAPWRWMRLGAAVSLLTLVVLVVVGLLEHRSEVRVLLRRRHARAPGDTPDDVDMVARS
ncbi:MAG: hypothetical protein R2737_16485 [Candidatus Nanopelagicales bacterium]